MQVAVVVVCGFVYGGCCGVVNPAVTTVGGIASEEGINAYQAVVVNCIKDIADVIIC